MITNTKYQTTVSLIKMHLSDVSMPFKLNSEINSLLNFLDEEIKKLKELGNNQNVNEEIIVIGGYEYVKKGVAPFAQEEFDRLNEEGESNDD